MKKLIFIFIVLGLLMLLTGKEKKRVMKPYTFVKGLEKVDFSKSSIDLKQLFAGCPNADCIPALTDPKFIKLKDSKLKDETLGIVVTYEGITKYYPYNILIWHEIVNDSIGDFHYAVTFCPLCGSGMVFDRMIGGKIFEFGVSGTLFNSNLVMYDKQTWSLWSQTRAKCVVGRSIGKELKLENMELVTFKQLKVQFPNSEVLSNDTGYKRDYTRNPYGKYNSIDRIFFPVHEINKNYPLKELFYVFKAEGTPVAVRISQFDDNIFKKNINGKEYNLIKLGGVVFIRSSEKLIPGYYEMWFSFYSTHGKKGIIWEK